MYIDWRAWLRDGLKLPAVAPGLQKISRGIGIVDRLAGLEGTASRLPCPKPATHTASYAIHNCQYNPGVGTDLGGTEPVVSAGVLFSAGREGTALDFACLDLTVLA
jgi:hypothetical protein